MVIDGQSYTADLIIYPDGEVRDPWFRKKGHRLSKEDIAGLIEAGPEVIVAGTGVRGRVIPEKDLGRRLRHMGIAFFAVPNSEAVALYNELSSKKRAGACFHLTC
jgi:hypothetical protein